ncbi:MAG: ATP-binding cassette domain-containing protein, partial [Janthinobacterium lividum]
MLLNSITLQLNAGDRVALSGLSGAGKSLFLRALALLDPLDGGRVLWHGKDVADIEIPTYRRQVAYVGQRPAMFDGTVEDNLRYPFSLKVYRDTRFDRDKVARLLRQGGREEDFLQKRASELSGGEAQIAALIRVLQLDP